MADTDTDFPADLLAAEREKQQTWERLAAIPLRPYEDTAGIEHRTDTGWTPEHGQAEDVLHRRLQELSAATATHPYWESFSGSDRVQARMRLKQAVLSEAQGAAE
ncbi:hypothetical protein E1265_10175 [Streptomyces sp. 8K308]|uniref:hypothetical protein n=1 Tax=Streptomyces sp. 8K308 TaxID=2530388 RepID=UPI001048692A|nr:hypothetical protein [Streptomyces sp. 8K308]TDC24279.1 hypothetical protein E1265_10175 [Streptomyces sp. 8K308]